MAIKEINLDRSGSMIESIKSTPTSKAIKHNKVSSEVGLYDFSSPDNKMELEMTD